MAAARFVVIGLAQVRSAWFSEVGRWSTSAMLPIEYIKAVSVEEVRARLRSGRGHSALLVDDSVLGIDRDLVEAARDTGCAVIVVETGRHHRRGQELGAAAVLPLGFSRDDLLSALSQVATLIERHGNVAPHAADSTDPVGYRGHLVAVTGPGGTGRSTVTMALAQGLARDLRWRDVTCVADLDLHAQQALLHGADDVVPGVLELVDAHRSGRPRPDAIRSLTWGVPDRGYHLLLGLRRHRDWSAVRPRAFAAGLDGLRRSFRMVVADVAADVEGEASTGSVDVEERNVIARSTLLAADLVVVVGRPGLSGLHALLRCVDDLLHHGVVGEAVLPVCNRAPRRPSARAEITSAFGALLRRGSIDPGVPSPLFLPERRQLEEALRDGVPLPHGWGAPLASAVQAILDRRPDVDPGQPDEEQLVPIRPGSLGHWSDADDPEGPPPPR